MENLKQNEIVDTKQSPLHTVTPLSKYLAMALFVVLPFLAGWIGYTYAPEKVVEVEKIVEVEKEPESQMSNYVSGYDIEAPESVQGFYTVPTKEPELANLTDVHNIYYVSGPHSQFIAQVAGACDDQTKVNDADNIDQLFDENKTVLQQAPNYSLNLEEIINCGSDTEGYVFASVRLDRPDEIPDSVSVYQRYYSESEDLSSWNLVIGYHPEATYFSPPLEHLQALKSNGVDSKIISDYESSIVQMY